MKAAWLKSLFALALLGLSSALWAKIQMPKIFGDNMVLQRDCQIAIWGSAAAGAEIRVEFKGQKAYAIADSNGKWKLFLGQLWADSEPAAMQIFEDGKLGAEIKNILVGEVWIVGGQSNMEWTIRRSHGFEKVKKRAAYPCIRYFSQNSSAVASMPQEDSPSGASWLVCSPENVGNFSGVAFFFAEEMFKNLDLPIGLVYTACGATEMASWIPWGFSSKLQWLDSYVKSFEREKSQYSRSEYEKRAKEFRARMDKFNADKKAAKAAGKPEPKMKWIDTVPPHKLTPWPYFKSPGMHYNAKVAPIAGYAARGVLWYQGEADSDTSEHVAHFEENFKLLIESWRSVFNNPKMPFIFAQLPSFSINQDWVGVRKAQASAAKNSDEVYMVCLIDCGEKNNIHPADKATVGLRMCRQAANKILAKKIVISDSPELKEVKYKASHAVVSFETFYSKLEGIGDARGFEILAGGKWKPCIAKLSGPCSVDISSPDGERIDGVRYLWKNWARPDVWLYNTEKLPAAPFEDLKNKEENNEIK